jgi:hypothetical protein
MTHNEQGRVVLSGLEKSVEIHWPTGKTVLTPASSLQSASDPTLLLAEQLVRVGSYFNQSLFGNRIRPYIVTPQRARGLAGYFAPQRYQTRDGSAVFDEIGLNIEIFHTLTLIELFAVIAHELTHSLQFHFGHYSPGGYHNVEFAEWAERIGLHTSHTGAPGGRRTGVRMGHFIVPDGAFARASAKLVAEGGDIFVVDRWAVQRTMRPTHEHLQEAKPGSSACFTCLACSLSGERTHAS